MRKLIESDVELLMKKYFYLFVTAQIVALYLPINTYAATATIDMECRINRYILSDTLLNQIDKNPNSDMAKIVHFQTEVKKWWQFWKDDQKFIISINEDKNTISSGLTTGRILLVNESSLSTKIYPDSIIIHSSDDTGNHFVDSYYINRMRGDFNWNEYTSDGKSRWSAYGKCYPLKRLF